MQKRKAKRPSKYGRAIDYSKYMELGFICRCVCNHFGMDAITLFSKTRTKDIILARQWFQYLARTLNSEYILSAKTIGEYYSDITGIKKGHATVLHSVKAIKNDIEIYPYCAEMEKELLKDINELRDEENDDIIGVLLRMCDEELVII